MKEAFMFLSQVFPAREDKNMMKKIWMSLILCLCMLAIPSAVVQATESDIIRNDESGIPDEILYKGILKEMGKKPNETFTRQEAESLKELDVRDNVKSLKGIGNLSQLEALQIQGNDLTSLKGVESLQHLTALSVPYNKIKSLKPIRNLTNLQYLMVELNQLKSLEGIENLTKLVSLNAGWNQITNVKPLVRLISLNNLGLQNNKLKSLKGIEKLTNLSGLDVRGNMLTAVGEIKRLKNLEELDISYNKIKKLPNIKSFNKLRYSLCEVHDNRLSEKEIRAKLPTKFFKKGKDRKQWLHNQVNFQNLNYKIKLLEPANVKQISKDTVRIQGRAMKGAYVELVCPSKKWRTKRVKVDDKGIFVLDNLNLKKWGGKTVKFNIYIHCNNDKIEFIGSDKEFKVKK